MGKGLIAMQDIPARTRIATEKPFLRAQTSILARDPPTMRHRADMKANVELASQKQQNLFLKLTNHYKSYEDPLTGSFFTIPYTGTVRSNALPLSLCPGFDGIDKFGVFLEISKASHSCRPNAQLIWNGEIGKATLHALHDISEGEAITITYLPESKVGEITEPEHVVPIWKFNCNCDFHIQSPVEHRVASNDIVERSACSSRNLPRLVTLLSVFTLVRACLRAFPLSSSTIGGSVLLTSNCSA
jgi:hypothetical protein